ncbi:MAG: histidine--tRNA ligase [Deltaproteobacteria bacterium]|nr:histidine--tRNA ligase [Deltaproteobacteria bacterium]
MAKQFQSVQGFNDILYPEVGKFQHIESVSRQYFGLFNFKEVKTPVLEQAGLFVRSIGNGTDIVEKEMYIFEDKGGEILSLRPEGTAPAVRAYLEHNIDRQDAIQKWFYIGPMFRHERPQKGRFRQFHQAGVEVFGIDDPFADIEVILLADKIVSSLAVKGVTVRLNSIGCPACRPVYLRELKSYLNGITDRLCEDCKRRIDTNPMRVLDCKKEGCMAATAGAPKTTDYLCSVCSAHFSTLRSGLDALRQGYTIDTRLVRGLDYYSRTVFEFTAEDAGAQNAVLAGGRYDYLVELLGGAHTPAIGFAMGIERIAALIDMPAVHGPDIFFIPITEEARVRAIGLADRLRRADKTCEIGYGEKTIKSMMRRADRLNAAMVIIIGKDELRDGSITLKRLSDGLQEKVDDATLLEAVRRMSQ